MIVVITIQMLAVSFNQRRKNMSKEEVKPSFSLKYLLLTLVTTLIISGGGIGVAKLIENKPKKELAVIDGFQTSLINDQELLSNQIEAKYYLKGDPKKEISSLFRKRVTIENVGTEGVENLSITAVLRGEELLLVSDPKITTEPREIHHAISIKKKSGSTDMKHEWLVSLLNPGESISFEYDVYSESEVDDIQLSIIPRKKDWTISKQIPSSNERESLAYFAAISGLTPVIFLLSLLAMSLPVYRIQWNRREDFRERYSSFFRFWVDHKPWDLFKQC